MTDRTGRHSRLLPAALAAAAALLSPEARATMSTDRMELQARLAVQNTFHHDSIESIDWVQERNELRIDLKYDLLPRGRELAGLTRARFNMLYRGRYDGIFDIRDDYGEHGYRRDDFRFPEGKIPREVFLDLSLAGFLSPLSARIGRQQVVWGEADVFRSIDQCTVLPTSSAVVTAIASGGGGQPSARWTEV